MNVLISSARRESGTATSVDQISIPSGRLLTMVKRASFLAAHRSASSCLFLAKRNFLALNGFTMLSTRPISLCMPSAVPENLFEDKD